MRNTLICTVGTSLFEGNLKRLSEATTDKPKNWKQLKDAYEKENWNRLVKELLKVISTSKICGAEINTIEEVRKKNWLSLEHIIFLVSDTALGINTGKVLKSYFEQRKDLKLKSVEYKVVDELQDERPKDFKTKGLRNLVREIGKYIQRFGEENVAIDATGGYKAQIAVAVLLGQALNIPVYYKHERFMEIIDFPPLPVSMDYQVLAENADILHDFEKGEIFSNEELKNIDEKLKVFLTEVQIEDKTLYELSALGQIYLMGFRLRYPRPVNLCKATNRKIPTFPDDHHLPKGFKEFVIKVWEQNKWIITINALPYDKQKSIKGIGFFVQDKGENKKRLVGTFKDENNFGSRFWIHTTDESAIALTWAAVQLNQLYRK